MEFLPRGSCHQAFHWSTDFNIIFGELHVVETKVPNDKAMVLELQKLLITVSGFVTPSGRMFFAILVQVNTNLSANPLSVSMTSLHWHSSASGHHAYER
jgi:hypothetical protein